jgi:hypothetical protein
MYWNIFHPFTLKLTIPEFHSILRGYEIMFFFTPCMLWTNQTRNVQKYEAQSLEGDILLLFRAIAWPLPLSQFYRVNVVETRHGISR